MDTITVSATYARNNFFGLLDKVANGFSVSVKKDNKLVANIVGIKKTTEWEALKKAAKRVHGIMPNYDLSQSPARQKWSWPSFGKWDK